MVEAGAKEVSEEEMVQALERAHAAIKEIVAGIDALAQRGRQEEDRASRSKEIGKEFYREVEEQGLRAARRRHADQGQARELRHASIRCSPNLIASIPEDEVERTRRRQGDLQGAEGEGHARRDRSSAASASTAARSTRSARSPSRSACCPRDARLGGVHARRDAGARHRDARHRRRPAEDRDGRRRDVEAVHAPLQLPAVLGR